MSGLHWSIREALVDLREDGRLAVLIDLISRSNERMRCWPSVELIETETNWSGASVNEAKKWLIKAGAIALVPYEFRVGREKTLPPRQHIYQLTGMIKLSSGKIVPYLTLNEETQKDVTALIEEMATTDNPLLSKTLPSETLLSKGKGINTIQGNTNTEESSEPRIRVPYSSEDDPAVFDYAVSAIPNTDSLQVGISSIETQSSFSSSPTASAAAAQSPAKRDEKTVHTDELKETKKKKSSALPPTYGDLFVMMRTEIYHANAESPKQTQMRVGKDAKALIMAYPDVTDVELKDFCVEWRSRQKGLSEPRGENLIVWFDTYRREWKKSARPQVNYVSVDPDDYVAERNVV